MRSLFVGSTGDHAGQSLVTWALAQDLKARGLRVSFLKPLFPTEKASEPTMPDPDGELFKEVLGLPEPLESICPVLEGSEPFGKRPAEGVARQLSPFLKERSGHTDLLFIMGRPEVFLDDPSSPISDTSLAQALEADFILVSRHLDLPRTIYCILSVCSLLGPRVKSVILNRVPLHQMQEVSKGLRERLSGRAIPPVMAVPEDPLLASRTLAEVVETTHGEYLFGQHRAGELVSGWSMGAAQVLGGELAVFRRMYNRIVLLGPEESEETPPRPVGVLLTAGRRPPPILYEVARKADLPLVLVTEDTFTILDRLERTPPRLSPREAIKVQRMAQWLRKEGKLDELWRSLGLPIP